MKKTLIIFIFVSLLTLSIVSAFPCYETAKKIGTVEGFSDNRDKTIVNVEIEDI